MPDNLPALQISVKMVLFLHVSEHDSCGDTLEQLCSAHDVFVLCHNTKKKVVIRLLLALQ